MSGSNATMSYEMMQIQPRTAKSQTTTADHNVSDDPAALHVHGFDCWYSQYHAIRNLDIQIAARRVTAFIGPSGCGKSTLLRWMNRMNDLVPGARAQGVMKLGDLDLLDRRVDVVALRLHVGMVFQRPNPFPKSIYDNIAYGPRLHQRLSRSDLDALVEQSLQQAGLWEEVKDRLKQSALSLSGGQQQRLCIARALAVGPEVLLMDEPCSALDPKSTAHVEDLISQLCQKYTIVIVTHNMQQAARVSDFTAFLCGGELIEFGATQDLFTKPEKKQTEDYIRGRFG